MPATYIIRQRPDIYPAPKQFRPERFLTVNLPLTNFYPWRRLSALHRLRSSDDGTQAQRGHATTGLRAGASTASSVAACSPGLNDGSARFYEVQSALEAKLMLVRSAP